MKGMTNAQKDVSDLATKSELAQKADQSDLVALQNTVANVPTREEFETLKNDVMGSILIKDTLESATLAVTKTSSGTQVYSGNVVPTSIQVGNGQYTVVISQFGETHSKTITVLGETYLDLSSDIVTVTPQTDAISWTINDVAMPMESVKVLKGITKTVRTVFGSWPDGNDICASGSISFSSDLTIRQIYSEPYIITASGKFVAPLTKTYQVVLTGGGGGGGGGTAGASYYNEDYLQTGHYGGPGGYGGQGGVVTAIEIELSKNSSTQVTIGKGGDGGAMGTYDSSASDPISDYRGKVGRDGGGTTFGTTSCNGGKGGSTGYISFDEYFGEGGDGGIGGNGSNSSTLHLFDYTVNYGSGGNGGRGSSTSDSAPGSGTSGEKCNSKIDWLSNVGNGGNGGKGGRMYKGGSGGTGGYGFNQYGVGGTGGNGGDSEENGTNGTRGSDGAVAIRVVL